MTGGRARHRKILQTLGALCIARGMTVFNDVACINPSDAVLHEAIPVSARVALWIISGLCVLVCSMRTRLHPYGYAFAALMPAERVCGYTWSFIEWVLPGGSPGALGSLAWIIWWGGISRLLLLVAGAPDRNQARGGE